MEHIGFALQAVLPTMMLLLLGAWLSSKKILSKTFSAEGDKLCLKILLPAMVLKSITSGKGDFSVYIKSIGFAYVMMAAAILLGLIIIPRFVSDRRQIAVIVQGIYRGNYTIYGIAFSQMLGGDKAAAIAAMIAAATLPALNTAGVAMFAHYSGKEKHSIWHTLMLVMKNPIIWGIILALILNAFDLALPKVINSFVGSLASMVTTFSFILLGTRLSREYIGTEVKLTVAVLAVKLILLPVLFIPVAVSVFGITGEELIPVFLFVASPCAITTYQLAVQYDADERLAGNLVTLSTLVSTVSICVIISILRSCGLI